MIFETIDKSLLEGKKSADAKIKVEGKKVDKNGLEFLLQSNGCGEGVTNLDYLHLKPNAYCSTFFNSAFQQSRYFEKKVGSNGLSVSNSR